MRTFIFVICFVSIFFSAACREEAAFTQKETPAKTISQPRNTLRYAQKGKWFKGATLHSATMKEWSQAAYNNRFLTAADFVMGFLKSDGVNLMTVDIENEIKPMAVHFVKQLDVANKNGYADDFQAYEVTAMLWVKMKAGT